MAFLLKAKGPNGEEMIESDGNGNLYVNDAAAAAALTEPGVVMAFASTAPQSSGAVITAPEVHSADFASITWLITTTGAGATVTVTPRYSMDNNTWVNSAALTGIVVSTLATLVAITTTPCKYFSYTVVASGANATCVVNCFGLPR